MKKETLNWVNSSDYDLKAAKHMNKGGRYLYVVFMCHLSLEKIFKALIAEQTDILPPKTHDLLLLADKAKIELPQVFKEFVGTINNASIVNRYPEDLKALIKVYNREVAGKYLKKTEEILEWLKQDNKLKEK